MQFSIQILQTGVSRKKKKGKLGHFQLVETFKVHQELHPRERAERAASASAFNRGHSRHPETVHVSTQECNTSEAKPRSLRARLRSISLRSPIRKRERQGKKRYLLERDS